MSEIPDGLRRRLGASFGTGGDRYDELRPDYPPAAVRWMTEGTVPGGAVADLGAGTGKLTGALAERGFDVVAIDPSADMLGRLRRRLPSVRTRVGTGEATGLEPASVDLVTFAQCWHWVDPAAGAVELRRIVRPGGAVAMVWNFLDVGVPWVAELTDLWHTVAAQESVDATRSAPKLGPEFGAAESTTVDWEQRMAPDALAALVTTRSYYLAASAADQRTIREQVSGFVHRRFGGVAVVGVPYRTYAYLLRRPTG